MRPRIGQSPLALLEALAAEEGARLTETAEGRFVLAGGGRRRSAGLASDIVRELLANGLLKRIEPGCVVAAPELRAWLRRQAAEAIPYRMQHGEVVKRHAPGPDSDALLDLAESPVAVLARRTGRGGVPWLSPHAVAAAERLRRDFEIGRLQPRVTANWSASINTGRRGGAGLTDLTDIAVAARLRVDRAMQAVGPELACVVVDICCFVKGLETVERERQWPARSAKLVLRLGLESLARHYGLSPDAEGRPSGRMQHWGAEGYRPRIS